ncbi:hypothetical protein BU24DRAFT_423366 [Aaosphaeria arxii CBS 175.79]|uniref:Methyltransferase SirN-like protein n=1 Tax=Aaosphaeria arxii CBS 175.79 TaxID=1450172 RepID=A0A6A5XNE4_9PLEO|nr:uncharacterized protein BU24DRAFT_423366 [Aaosphaeria arxii CBS 175.79]KAF2014409.1 hypothetical protein BU24DRAFT_423366 [Aaosphaeria arxii CBS 175.79]
MQKLIWAPIDLSKPSLRILDSAAANGKWIEDVRKSLSAEVQETSTFISTDVTDIFFPKPEPTGISYFAQSMLEDWPESLVGTLDLVHQRLALPAANKAQVQSTISRFIGLLKPGGYIQFVEADHSIAKGPAMTDFFRLLSEIFKVMETGNDYAPQLKRWFEDAGLEDVQEKVFDIPIGAANENADIGKKGALMFSYGVRGLVDVAKTLPTSFSKEELVSLEDRMREENLTSGGVWRLHCVWGRRPVVES